MLCAVRFGQDSHRRALAFLRVRMIAAYLYHQKGKMGSDVVDPNLATQYRFTCEDSLVRRSLFDFDTCFVKKTEIKEVLLLRPFGR